MRHGPEGKGWDFEIVHRDLKPGNGMAFVGGFFVYWGICSRGPVFLGDPNPEQGFPFYPVAKTGDFGLAVMTHADDPANPGEYRGAGTFGYKAPVSAAIAADVMHGADSFRRSKSSTTRPGRINIGCRPTPTSGPSARPCSNS